MFKMDKSPVILRNIGVYYVSFVKYYQHNIIMFKLWSMLSPFQDNVLRQTNNNYKKNAYEFKIKKKLKRETMATYKVKKLENWVNRQVKPQKTIIIPPRQIPVWMTVDSSTELEDEQHEI